MSRSIYSYNENDYEFILTEDEISYYMDNPPPGYAPIAGEIHINEDILKGMYEGLGKYFKTKTYTTIYEGRPALKTDDIQGDSQYDWMEQAKFKFQRDDLVEWKSKSGISKGNIIEGYLAPDQVYYSVYVEAGGYELVISVPEKELKKVV